MVSPACAGSAHFCSVLPLCSPAHRATPFVVLMHLFVALLISSIGSRLVLVAGAPLVAQVATLER
jgi:hypothetical protein